VWDVRHRLRETPKVVNSVSPLRVISTESPQVSCLAVTSLFLVHGGNDGLVQAWDRWRPLLDLFGLYIHGSRLALVAVLSSRGVYLGVGNTLLRCRCYLS